MLPLAGSPEGDYYDIVVNVYTSTYYYFYVTKCATLELNILKLVTIKIRPTTIFMGVEKYEEVGQLRLFCEVAPKLYAVINKYNSCISQFCVKLGLVASP